MKNLGNRIITAGIKFSDIDIVAPALGLQFLNSKQGIDSKIVIKKGLGLLNVNSERLFANQIEAPVKKQVFHETSEVFLEFIEFRQKKYSSILLMT